MQKISAVYLHDMLRAIEKIEDFTRELDPEHFEQSPMVQDAVIRNCEVIGEAANRLHKVDAKLYFALDLDVIVNLRNLLIHNYDEIDMPMLWATVHQDLPKLKQLLEQRISK